MFTIFIILQRSNCNFIEVGLLYPQRASWSGVWFSHSVSVSFADNYLIAKIYPQNAEKRGDKSIYQAYQNQLHSKHSQVLQIVYAFFFKLSIPRKIYQSQFWRRSAGLAITTIVLDVDFVILRLLGSIQSIHISFSNN